MSIVPLGGVPSSLTVPESDACPVAPAAAEPAAGAAVELPALEEVELADGPELLPGQPERAATRANDATNAALRERNVWLMRVPLEVELKRPK
jgi:hypothetical protein